MDHYRYKIDNDVNHRNTDEPDESIVWFIWTQHSTAVTP